MKQTRQKFGTKTQSTKAKGERTFVVWGTCNQNAGANKSVVRQASAAFHLLNPEGKEKVKKAKETSEDAMGKEQ